MTKGEIFVYGKNAGGGRNVGVEVDGIRVLVESSGEETDKAAEKLARSIAERHEANTVAEGERESFRRKELELCARIDREVARTREARSALACVINGRRRFFGPVLCVAGPNGWGGEVWLQDPEKRDRGMGLSFSSLVELRRIHPELWIVRPEGDGILLDVCPIRETETEVAS